VQIKRLKSDSDQGSYYYRDASFLLTDYFCFLRIASSTSKSNLIVFVHFIATPAQGDIDDEASIARHSKRLQDELRESSPDKKVINELMDAEFSARRSFITKTDVRTRMRDTVAKYHILSNGNEVLIINDSYAQKWLFCTCYKQEMKVVLVLHLVTSMIYQGKATHT